MEGLNALEILLDLMLASLGGVVHRLAESERDPKKRHGAGAYISSAVVSLFVGNVAYFLLLHFGAAQELTVALTSVAGFIGTPVIYTIFGFLAKRAGVEVKTDVKEDEKQ